MMSTLSGPFWDERLMIEQSYAPDVLAVGDSWFWYPVNNLLNPLFNVLGGSECILAYGDNGAEAIDYVTYYRGRIAGALKEWRKTIKAVLISGGGNDFAGLDDMFRIIKPDCKGVTDVDDCFRRGQPDTLFREVAAAYIALIAMVRSTNPACAIILHNYDRAIPTGKGFVGNGNWLRAPMDAANVDRSLQQQLVNRLMFAFTNMLEEQVAANKNVWLVDTARMMAISDPDKIEGPGTLTDKKEWANELHPTLRGFNKMARAWKNTLADAGLV
jgi:hypothetical protein